MSCSYKMPSEDKDKEIRIVLVGVTGKGRTSTQRTIMGGMIPDNDEDKCLKLTKDVAGHRVVVVDTPGLCVSGDDEEVLKEVKRSIKLLHPGPHVFLYVMTMETFTEQYKDTLDLIQSTFGKNILKYTMVLFTNQYQIEQTIEEFIRKKDDDKKSKLEVFIDQFRGRYYAIDNNDESPEQVVKLLKKIKDMIAKNDDRYYTTKMLRRAEKAKKKKETPEEEYKTALNVIHKAGLVGTAVGCMVGYFVGGGELTSSMGAATGALACGILAMVSAGLVIKSKKLISKCRSP